MKGYTKLCASMYTGSMRGKPDLLLVFPYVLANADATNKFDETPQCIADALGIPVERVQTALTVLESPDPLSRTQDHDGRRLVRLDNHRDWGWLVVNRQKYWDMFSGADYRAKTAARVKRWRERHKAEAAPTDAEIPSLEEVITQGQFINVSETICRSFHSYHNDNNYWLNRFGRLINWRDKLISWRDRESERKSVGGNGHINPVAQKMALEEELSRHPANKDSAFYDAKVTELQRSDYRTKRKKLRDLTAFIANGGTNPAPPHTPT